MSASSEDKTAPSHAIDEYVLLQSKLDKIGDFKFKVRSWALTLVSGVLIAGLTSKEFPETMAGSGGFILTALFFLLETEQSHHKDVLIARLARLERTERRSNPSFPQIATAFFRDRQHSQLLMKRWPGCLKRPWVSLRTMGQSKESCGDRLLCCPLQSVRNSQCVSGWRVNCIM